MPKNFSSPSVASDVNPHPLKRLTNNNKHIRTFWIIPIGKGEDPARCRA